MHINGPIVRPFRKFDRITFVKQSNYVNSTNDRSLYARAEAASRIVIDV